MTYYRLNCEICGFNLYSEDTNIKLVEYKRSKIQGEIPKLDPETGKISGVPKLNSETSELTYPKMISLPKKYKCPKCGRLLSSRKMKETPIETKNDNEQDINKRGAGGFERYQL